MVKNRLAPLDWINAGASALTRIGPSALKAEALARDLATTKGSFYWHFKDVPAYHAALLSTWERMCAAKLTNLAELQATPAIKLRLIPEIFGETAHTALDASGTEAAIRAWSHENAQAQATVATVDRLRIEAIAALLQELDLTNAELSHLLYAAFLGLNNLTQTQETVSSQSFVTLVDLILALYEDP